MRTALLRAWSRLRAGLRTAERFTLDSLQPDNLADESLALTIQGKPKDLRLLRLMVPITIGGHLKDPSIGLNPVPLGAQAGVATALGVVLTPLAAVLPFIDVGLAEDANCAALMQDGQKAGVSGTKGTTPAKQ